MEHLAHERSEICSVPARLQVILVQDDGCFWGFITATGAVVLLGHSCILPETNPRGFFSVDRTLPYARQAPFGRQT